MNPTAVEDLTHILVVRIAELEWTRRNSATLRWATSTTGIPIVCYDEGKTWTTFTPDDPKAVPKAPTVEQMTVSWVKKDD